MILSEQKKSQSVADVTNFKYESVLISTVCNEDPETLDLINKRVLFSAQPRQTTLLRRSLVDASKFVTNEDVLHNAAFHAWYAHGCKDNPVFNALVDAFQKRIENVIQEKIKNR